MTVGFTGTRKGMSTPQVMQLRYILALLAHADRHLDRVPEFHHGGARGADTEAVAMARPLNFALHWHPCLGVVRDSQDPYLNDVWHGVFQPLERNHRIVAACHVLIAAPENDEEQLRSGTWATVRYARKAGKPVVMLSRGKKGR